MSRDIRRALISVYDKTGVVDFARALCDEFGVEIISTGGTAKTLTDAGLPVTLVEKITGFPEMLDGRVKTLHPKIHAAILADRDNPKHMRQLEAAGIAPIDMVVVNLYPFEKTIAEPDCTFEQAIEMIDIGGPCLLRAAAKNHKHVICVSRQARFDGVLESLRHFSDYLRESLAAEAFYAVSRYDARVTRYLDRERTRGVCAPLDALFFQGITVPKYGENPHQAAAVCSFTLQPGGLVAAGVGRERTQEQPPLTRGGLLSFNNYVDAHAALDLCAELTRAANLGGLWHRLLAGGESADAKAAPTAHEFPPIGSERHHRRNLPHIQRPGATYFVTFRIRDGRLSETERDIVMECCLFPHTRKCSLHACVVMPDHVHLLITPLPSDTGLVTQLGEIVKGIKGVSARRINELRDRTGSLWQDEYFDHIIRSQQAMWETIDYIHENPSRKKLDHNGPYSWCVFEDQPAWDTQLHAVEGSADPLRAGQRLPGQEVTPRPWFEHRLIAGATSSTIGDDANIPEHRRDTCAASPADATDGKSATFVACFIKHTNACGTGVADSPLEAFRRAYLGDPNAAMGGVLAVNFPVDAEFAARVMETYQRLGKPLKEAGHAAAPGGFFAEVWVAPAFSDDAIALIRGEFEPTKEIPTPPKKEWGKRVRLLAVGEMDAEPDASEMDIKRIAGGVLLQTRDLVGLNEDDWQVVTKRAPSESEMDDMRLAWLVCKHTKSNAISICRDGMLIGNGAGQMSRVMSCRVATWLATDNGHEDMLQGAAAASDAFFPFRDGPDLLIDAGVTAIIQPGGSKRDGDVIAACDEHDVAMVFTGTRHFRH